MAHASKKKIGPGAHGKGTGVGGLSDVPKEKVGDNQVLSNRDKKLHSRDRGQDSRNIQNEQLQDNAANRLSERWALSPAGIDHATPTEFSARNSPEITLGPLADP